MDVNGTHMHLLFGRADWGTLLHYSLCDTDNYALRPLEEIWTANNCIPPPVEWDGPAINGTLQLQRKTPIFQETNEVGEPDLSLRRGADRDQYGNWYWIDEAENGIRFLAAGERESILFWSWEMVDTKCDPGASADFVSYPSPLAEEVTLRGLAVTERHFLVVGNVTERGLLIFDLHGGNVPTFMQWSETVPFVPWDMIARPDGGVFILDRGNAQFWVLNEHFQVMALLNQSTSDFQDKDSETESIIAEQVVTPQAVSLISDPPELVFNPISIENGPDGTVLILHTDLRPDEELAVDEERAASVVDWYNAQGVLQRRFALDDVIDAVEMETEFESLQTLHAIDFAYVHCCEPKSDDDDCIECLDLSDFDEVEGDSYDIIYLARADGNQSIALIIDIANDRLVPQPDYLPMRRWVGKGLVAADNRPYYDFADRWVPLQVFTDCRYDTEAVILTAIDFEAGNLGQQFDSGIPGCVWHRLFLDANIPVGTSITIRARAADEPDLLQWATWQTQPNVYLRNDGSELPYYEPQTINLELVRTGTWELLFQEIVGRYIQLELTLRGNGRATPKLETMRIWYPRFSYLENYLPTIYQEDAISASFTERWLANLEGFYTNLEDKIEQLQLLIDPRTAPRETLDWLAGWMALLIDPLWDEERKRLFIQYAHWLYDRRGTPNGIETVLRLYLDDVVGEWLFDVDCINVNSRIRIIEYFLTRNVDPRIFGDPTSTEATGDPQDSAHRFAVLLPFDLTLEQFQMAERIVHMEKPAHTVVDVKQYWDVFRVGESRIGLDTSVGESRYLQAYRLGEHGLPDGYLGAAYPFDIRNRIISDRDRLGDIPEL